MNRTKSLSLLLAAALLLALAGCGGNAAQETAEVSTAPAGVAVQVQTVEKGSISNDTRVSGRVSAGDQRSIYISTAAKCTAVYVEAGDLVEAGDKICTLDLGSTLAQYNAASLSYSSSAQSYADQSAVFANQIALLEKNVNDLKALYAIGAASQAEIDSAQLQLESTIAQRNSTLSQLQAAMQNAQSSLEQLGTLLEDVDSRGNVVSPIAGTVASISAEANSFISSAMPVAVITASQDMKVSVSVSEAVVPKLNIGDTAAVSVSAIGQSFDGTVRAVERAANMQTQLYTVTVAVPDGVAGLLSGMFADVTFHTDTAEDTIVIPSEVILTRGSTQYVYVVEGGDTARYVEISTGLTGDGVTEVTAGLTEGQALVTVGQAYLSDGDTVRIVEG
jgi:RND family efflux transporter MFP subunit